MSDKLLDRAALLSMATAPTPKVKRIDVAGYGHVFIRVMCGAELDTYESENYELDQKTGRTRYTLRNARARLAVRCLCNEAGHRLFTNDGEAATVGRLDAPLLDAIYEEARKFNGMDSTEDKEKNSSKPEADDASGTALPAISA